MINIEKRLRCKKMKLVRNNTLKALTGISLLSLFAWVSIGLYQNINWDEVMISLIKVMIFNTL